VALPARRSHRTRNPRSEPAADTRWRREIGRLRRRGDWSGTALLEGPHLVGEALDAGIALQRVFATRAWMDSAAAAPILRRLSNPPHQIDARTLEHLADADAPQGILAIARLPRGGAEELPRGRGPVLFADAVQDPGNVGALARVAEAAGAAGLALAPGSAHPNHPRALRGSAGSLLRLPVAWHASPAAIDATLGTVEAHWLLLDAHATADLFALPAKELAAVRVVAVGNEAGGLSRALRARRGLAVRIPLHPPVESLNVATAAAIVLFHLSRPRL
jgi:TrmH family RNA methyltransferase